MNRILRSALFVLGSLGGTLSEVRIAAGAPADRPGYVLTFDDEFDGSSLDASKWQRRYKWGEAVINDELEAYVDGAFTVHDGVLDIVGKHQTGNYAGKTLDYTSGVISSIHEQTYGYFESRLRMPKGKGLWPAFWLLGGDGATGVNEIDIHEFLGHELTTVHMTVHWGQSYSVGHQSDGSDFTGPDFSADFHTFGLEWDSSKIVWTIDGVERKTHEGEGVPHAQMYAILNLAIGGGWPGAPDSTTSFPADYSIDYVRMYERAEAGTDGGAGGSSANAGGTGGSMGNGGISNAAGGAGGTAGAGGAGGSNTTNPSNPSGGADATGSSRDAALDGPIAVITPSTSSKTSGCSCRVAHRKGASVSWALVVLGSLLARRRRRT